MLGIDDRQLFELIDKNTTVLAQQLQIFKEMLHCSKNGNGVSAEILLVQITELTELSCQTQNCVANLSSALNFANLPESK